MNKLWTFGDSFPGGVGIDKYVDGFTKQIADTIGLIDYNHSVPGSNNSFLIELLKSLVHKINKNDCVLVVLTTPHREDKRFDHIPIFLQHIEEVVKLLDEKECYYKITQSLNPIFGYDYSVGDRDYPNFIEWKKKNNTLIDIITDNWLGDKTNIFMDEGQVSWSEWNHTNFRDRFCKMDGKHPSELGHKLIANKLLEYLGDFND